MAIYEFRCGACGERFETSVPMADADRLMLCVCGTPARRVISPVGLSGARVVSAPALPTSSAVLHGGRAAVSHLRAQADAAARRMERHPETVPPTVATGGHCSTYAPIASTTAPKSVAS